MPAWPGPWSCLPRGCAGDTPNGRNGRALFVKQHHIGEQPAAVMPGDEESPSWSKRRCRLTKLARSTVSRRRCGGTSALREGHSFWFQRRSIGSVEVVGSKSRRQGQMERSFGSACRSGQKRAWARSWARGSGTWRGGRWPREHGGRHGCRRHGNGFQKGSPGQGGRVKEHNRPRTQRGRNRFGRCGSWPLEACPTPALKLQPPLLAREHHQ